MTDTRVGYSLGKRKESERILWQKLLTQSQLSKTNEGISCHRNNFPTEDICFRQMNILLTLEKESVKRKTLVRVLSHKSFL